MPAERQSCWPTAVPMARRTNARAAAAASCQAGPASTTSTSRPLLTEPSSAMPRLLRDLLLVGHARVQEARRPAERDRQADPPARDPLLHALVRRGCRRPSGGRRRDTGRSRPPSRTCSTLTSRRAPKSVGVASRTRRACTTTTSAWRRPSRQPAYQCPRPGAAAAAAACDPSSSPASAKPDAAASRNGRRVSSASAASAPQPDQHAGRQRETRGEIGQPPADGGAGQEGKRREQRRTAHARGPMQPFRRLRRHAPTTAGNGTPPQAGAQNPLPSARQTSQGAPRRERRGAKGPPQANAEGSGQSPV